MRSKRFKLEKGDQQILVARQKHDTQYFKFTTPEEQDAASLQLFKDFDDMEYYFDLNEESVKEDQEEIEELKSMIAGLKNIKKGDEISSLVEKSEKNLKYKEDCLKTKTAQVAWYDKAKKGDAEAAYKLICLRDGHEYEGWSIERLR